MPLFERYVLRRVIGASIAPLLVFTGMIWIIQFLRELDLVTTSGQSISVFLLITALAMPAVLQVLLPFALLTGMITTLNSLNEKNELAAVTAAGAPLRTIMRPVVAAGMLVCLLLFLLHTLFTPLSVAGLRDIMAWVRADLLANVMQDGGFRSLDGRKLTIHIRDRNPDGSFNDLFVNDERNALETVQYIALRGAMLRDTRGSFLILDRGKLIRERKDGSSFSVTNFDTYAIDLSKFGKMNYVLRYHPREMPTRDLWQAKEGDKAYEEFGLLIDVEFYERISSPLYPVAFAVLAFAFLGRARTSRANSALSIYTMILAALILRTAGFYLYAAAHTDPLFAKLLFAPPLAGIAVGIWVIIADIQIRVPGWLVRQANRFSASLKRRRRGKLADAADAPL